MPSLGGMAKLGSEHFPANNDHEMHTCFSFWYNAEFTDGNLKVTIL